MSITVWVIENILYGLMRPATSIAAATALMAAFALSPLMAVSSKKRGAQAPLFFCGENANPQKTFISPEVWSYLRFQRICIGGWFCI